MKRLELIRLLSSSDEEDVLVIIDGREYDISQEVEHIPEAFDGFVSFFPAALGLKLIEE